MTRLVVLSDTHIRRGSARRLPPAAYEALAEADLVLHAGDVVSADLLHELSAFAPVHAVLGNNDHDLVGTLPETLVLDIEGVRIAMVHDAGPRRGREARLRGRFPGADLVVFGHSHVPVDADGLDGQRLFNPGSPTERRLQPHHTVGVLDVDRGRVVGHELRVVGPVQPGGSPPPARSAGRNSSRAAT